MYYICICFIVANRKLVSTNKLSIVRSRENGICLSDDVEFAQVCMLSSQRTQIFSVCVMCVAHRPVGTINLYYDGSFGYFGF